MTRLLRYYGGSDSCRSGPFQRTATASDRSLCFMHITFGPFRLQPPDAFQGRFCTLPLISLDFPCGSGLHPSIPGSPPHPAESSSPGPLSHCPHDGLVVHLGLLSTLPRGNAVISSYGPENVCPTGTCTLLIVCTHRRMIAGVSPVIIPQRVVGTALPMDTLGTGIDWNATISGRTHSILAAWPWPAR